ncbi:hypothetical protein CSOJ01_01399 [Colletotrichum sojae]|uniref:Uncharacterized protein n=1 Tax=Colletotrichum sojae TaxID=2175907 RepID=A0A8H6JTY8_9PEZI|nr:hypothetical protein CSOJ01_01399 [Colletotrichum sojae]
MTVLTAATKCNKGVACSAQREFCNKSKLPQAELEVFPLDGARDLHAAGWQPRRRHWPEGNVWLDATGWGASGADGEWAPFSGGFVNWSQNHAHSLRYLPTVAAAHVAFTATSSVSVNGPAPPVRPSGRPSRLETPSPPLSAPARIPHRLPPPSNESRAPPPCPQTPYPQKAGRPCRFGAGPTRQSRLEDTHTHDVAELRDRTVAASCCFEAQNTSDDSAAGMLAMQNSCVLKRRTSHASSVRLVPARHVVYSRHAHACSYSKRSSTSDSNTSSISVYPGPPHGQRPSPTLSHTSLARHTRPPPPPILCHPCFPDPLRFRRARLVICADSHSLGRDAKNSQLIDNLPDHALQGSLSLHCAPCPPALLAPGPLSRIGLVAVALRSSAPGGLAAPIGCGVYACLGRKKKERPWAPSALQAQPRQRHEPKNPCLRRRPRNPGRAAKPPLVAYETALNIKCSVINPDQPTAEVIGTSHSSCSGLRRRAV